MLPKRNSTDYKELLAQAKNIVLYSRDNAFLGQEVQTIDDYAKRYGELELLADNSLKLTVHKRKWFKFEVKHAEVR